MRFYHTEMPTDVGPLSDLPASIGSNYQLLVAFSDMPPALSFTKILDAMAMNDCRVHSIRDQRAK